MASTGQSYVHALYLRSSPEGRVVSRLNSVDYYYYYYLGGKAPTSKLLQIPEILIWKAASLGVNRDAKWLLRRI
jgi:hypothetical protein